MYLPECTCMRVYAHTLARAHTHINTHAQMHASGHTHTHKHTQMHASGHTDTHTHTITHAQMDASTHERKLTYTYTSPPAKHLHTRTYTQIHTKALAHSLAYTHAQSCTPTFTHAQAQMLADVTATFHRLQTASSAPSIRPSACLRKGHSKGGGICACTATPYSMTPRHLDMSTYSK